MASSQSDKPKAVPRGAALGLSVLLFSALYLLSDVIEAMQGGFSNFQLLLTLVAEAAIPVLVFGIYAAQRPQIGRLGPSASLCSGPASCPPGLGRLWEWGSFSSRQPRRRPRGPSSSPPRSAT